MSRDSLIIAFFVGVCFCLVVWLSRVVAQYEDDRLCRHAIQREFGKTREEAAKIVREGREWENDSRYTESR